MYGLAGYKHTPGMPDMNKILAKIEPGYVQKRSQNGKPAKESTGWKKPARARAQEPNWKNT